MSEYTKGTLPMILERDEEFENVRNLKEGDHIRLGGKPYFKWCYFHCIGHFISPMDGRLFYITKDGYRQHYWDDKHLEEYKLYKSKKI